MFHNDRIKINDIIFVNHRIGNKKGSYTKFETDYTFHYQLLYKLSGEAIITFDKKQVTEKADCLRFLPNPAHFRYAPLYTAEVIEQGESINIGFTSDFPLPDEIIVKKYNNSLILKQLFPRDSMNLKQKNKILKPSKIFAILFLNMTWKFNH